ncbi:MAG: transcriptional regulator [Gammaproteobacteria bacterium RIFCSPHIGHO2_12_FULL_41_15]|nr:MAG: transcriptional regulator [Gammaproteobacteria bacterium RIFCSPHIGHO2_12_FULL_41_15]
MLIHTPKELALYFHQQRKRQSLSQHKISDLVGLKQTTVSSFENHPESTKLDTLFRLLAAANLEFEILPRDDIKTQSEWQEEW